MSAAFRYRAANAEGGLVEGVLTAETKQAAIDALRQRSLVPVAIEESAVGQRGRFRLERRKGQATATALRSIATLLGAGTTIDRSLQFASEHVGNERVGAALRSIRSDVERGVSVADAFAKQGRHFGPMTAAVLGAAQESGSLDAGFARVADHTEQSESLKSEALTALLYPALMAVVAAIGVTVLLVFVLPRFAAMLADIGGQLPLSTRLLLSIASLLARWWFVIAAIIGFGAWYFVTSGKRQEVRLARDERRLSWPVVGKLEREMAAASFFRSFGVLLSSGLGVIRALQVAAAGVSNTAIRTRIEGAVTAVGRGEGVARAMGTSLPALGVQLLAVGEESGTLAQMALRAAETYDGEVRRSLRTMVGLIEPIMILGFGALVGFIALAMLQAIYAVNTGIL